MIEWIVVLIILVILLFASIKILDQWEYGIVLTFGKYSRKMSPGFNVIIPFVERAIKVDTRIRTIDVPKQEAITKDNVPVMINAVLYYKVTAPEDALLKISDFEYATSQYAQTALRDAIGAVELDELLTDRDKVAIGIRESVDKETAAWGVDVTTIKMQDIELPADMKRAMARQAEAEREKRANIIISQGEVQASKNLREAAENLAKQPGAMHLRTLQTVSDISSDPSNKIVILTPVEILDAFKKFATKK